MQDYEHKKNLEENRFQEYKNAIEGGYNLVLPPLNGINQSGRGGQVGTDFVPTTNSSTNWNNDNMTGQNQFTPANGRQFHD